MRKGIAMVLSAPSGAGKSTLTAMLRERFPRLGYSVSCTTRAMRPGETEGKDYFFLSEEEFIRMRNGGQFAEWAQVHNNWYGTPLGPVRTMLAEGKDVLFDIDVQGAAQIKATIPEAIFVFILPPSMAELKRRLLARASDTGESIKLRMANAVREMEEAFWYDALIINADREQAAANLAAVYQAAALRPCCVRSTLEQLLEEAHG